MNRGAEEIFESLGSDDLSAKDVGRSETSSIQLRNSIAAKSMVGEEFSALRVDPSKAFEVFSGRVFFPSDGLECYPEGSVERKIESPFQRLARLRRELSELESDLSALAQETSAEESSTIAAFQAEAQRLVTKATNLNEHPALKIIEEKGSNISLTKLKEILRDVTVAPSKATEPVAHGVQDCELVESSIEKRIFALETLLGASLHSISIDAMNLSKSTSSIGLPSTPTLPLFDTLLRLEQKLALIDSGSIDAIKNKISSLKIELETLGKARSSIAESRAVESFKKVEDMYGMLQKVEHLSEILPALVMRFKSLENVHFVASNISLRLQQMESSVEAAHQDLRANKGILRDLQKGLSDNLAAMERNMEKIEARISSLSSK